MSLDIVLTSVFVDDQEKALEFYTGKLGFIEKEKVSLGQFRWLTVVSANHPEGTQLLLEPDENPIARAYTQGLIEQGIPATSFGVENIEEECQRLTELGVRFTMPPTAMGTVTVAVLDDTCGNLIQLVQRL